MQLLIFTDQKVGKNNPNDYSLQDALFMILCQIPSRIYSPWVDNELLYFLSWWCYENLILQNSCNLSYLSMVLKWYCRNYVFNICIHKFRPFTLYFYEYIFFYSYWILEFIMPNSFLLILISFYLNILHLPNISWHFNYLIKHCNVITINTSSYSELH